MEHPKVESARALVRRTMACRHKWADDVVATLTPAEDFGCVSEPAPALSVAICPRCNVAMEAIGLDVLEAGS